MTNRPKPVVLLVLDGWGYSEDPDHNAIMAADTPHWDALWQRCSHTLIETSGIEVGLPQGQMGNSEVGHLNLGSGRVVYQDLTRIEAAIEDGSFKDNPALTGAVDQATAVDGAIHIMGLLSPGGVHSHEDQIVEMVRLAVARGAEEVYLHAMLDGRDMPPKSAKASLEKLDQVFSELGAGRIATLCGRYYAMDRDKRWPRVEKAYRLYTEGESEHRYGNAIDALEAAYARDETDEFVQPTLIGGAAPVADGDAIVFMNFRADRARQISNAFLDDDFDGFERRQRPKLAAYVTLTRYHQDLAATAVAFPPLEHHNVLGEYISDLGLTQLRAAETEKYAHVTFFFNGGREKPFPGEDRALVPSPKVATYDLQPEMSAPAVTDRLVEAIRAQNYDVIISNFANADMVGHTGKFDATIEAIEALDKCIGRLVEALDEVGAAMLITADHGNAEQLIDHDTGQSHTAHTSNKVPLVLVGRDLALAEGGVLADVAPTMLTLMDLPQPDEMTGRSLIVMEQAETSCA